MPADALFMLLPEHQLIALLTHTILFQTFVPTSKSNLIIKLQLLECKSGTIRNDYGTI
jgi:hypothetical protein